MDQQRHILVVDDAGEVRDVIVLMLQARGHRVSSVESGLAMRDFLNTNDPVDAVVLDCVMPGEQGFTLIDHLKQLRLPVVMISGSPSAISLAEEHGLKLLQKPFRPHQLHDALDRALSKFRAG